MRSLKERFWRKWRLIPNGCWLWTGTTTPYGKLRVGSRMVGAHRVSYTLYKGEIPEGLHVLHDCDNPACVNPDHLSLGTQKDNSDDKFAKGRGMVGDAHRNRKIDSKLAEAIRQAGGLQKDIATRFGISPAQVSRIRSGKYWRNSEEANARSERKL